MSPTRRLLDGLGLIWTLAEKDLRIELRSRQAFYTTLFFSFLILMVFNFAFDAANQDMRKAAPGILPGILWVALIFPGVIQLNRSFQSEREEGTLLGILLSPMDRGLIFLGKFLANWIFLVAVNLVTLAIFMAVYNFPLTSSTLWMLLLILLASLGFSAVGTLFGAMVSNHPDPGGPASHTAVSHRHPGDPGGGERQHGGAVGGKVPLPLPMD